MEERRRKSPRDWLRIIFRRRTLFLLGASLFAVAAMLGARYLPVKYKGTAKFQRRVDPAAEKLTAARSESLESRRLTLTHDLGGETAVRSALEKHPGLLAGLPRTPDRVLTAEGERLKRELIRRISEEVARGIRWEAQSQEVHLVSVSFEHSDPNWARDIPNILVKEYIDGERKAASDRLKASRATVQVQVDRCKGQIESARKEKVDFEVRYAGFMPDQPGALDLSIRTLESDIDATSRQKSLAEADMARLEMMIAGMSQTTSTQPATGPSSRPASLPATAVALDPGAVSPASQPSTRTATRPVGEPAQEVWGPNPRRAELEEALRQAEAERDLLTKVQGMKGDHPRVQAQLRKIEQIRKWIEDEPQEVRTQSVYQRGQPTSPMGLTDLLLRLATARSDAEFLGRELDRLKERLRRDKELQGNYGPIRTEYQQILDRSRDRENELKLWEQRLNDLQMAVELEEAGKREEVKSVQAAQFEVRPSSPSLLLVLGFAVAGGLAFGAGLVLLMSFMDRSVMTPEEASEAFDVPIHGVIGEIVTPSQRARRQVRRWLLGPIVTLVVLAAAGASSANLVLWLRYPDTHRQWREDLRRSPYQFCAKRVREAGDKLEQVFASLK